jgi:hypothetical protein
MRTEASCFHRKNKFNISLQNFLLIFSVDREISNLSLTTTLLHYYTTTLPHYYTTTPLHYYTTTLLHYYTTTLPHYYTTTLPHYYTTRLLHYYTTMSPLQLQINPERISQDRLYYKKYNALRNDEKVRVT